MRLTAASVALFAGMAAAIPQGDMETVYSTEDVTITSCGPTVSDCPSRQTSTPQAVEAVPSSSPSAMATPSSSPVAPVEVPSSSPQAPAPAPAPTSSAPAVPQKPTSHPVVPVQVQVTSSSAKVVPVTTCIPTTSQSTMMVPVATPSMSTPAAGGGGVLPRPSGAAGRGTSSVPVIPGPSGAAAASGSASGSPRYVHYSNYL